MLLYVWVCRYLNSMLALTLLGIQVLSMNHILVAFLVFYKMNLRNDFHSIFTNLFHNQQFMRSLASLLEFAVVCFLDKNNSECSEVKCNVVLICIFPMANDGGHFSNNYRPFADSTIWIFWCLTVLGSFLIIYTNPISDE